MITLVRSHIDPRWYEVRRGEEVLQEIEVRFQLFRIPRSFMSVEAALRWLQETERKLAKNKVHRLLGARSYPKTLLFRKLMEKGYGEEVCRGIVDELEQLGYIQDEGYAAQLIEREFRRGYGPRVIEMKLKSKGLGTELVRKIVTESMQREKIRELMKKKSMQAIARRGFDFHLVMQEN
jgi:SOS response regulatory protein OraA/RecX